MEIYNSFKNHSFLFSSTQQQINISFGPHTRVYTFSILHYIRIFMHRVYVNRHALTFDVYIHFLCFFIYSVLQPCIYVIFFLSLYSFITIFTSKTIFHFSLIFMYFSHTLTFHYTHTHKQSFNLHIICYWESLI